MIKLNNLDKEKKKKKGGGGKKMEINYFFLLFFCLSIIISLKMILPHTNKIIPHYHKKKYIFIKSFHLL